MIQSELLKEKYRIQKKLSKESLSVHDYFKRSQNAARAIAKTYDFQLQYVEQSNNVVPLPVSPLSSLELNDSGC